MNATEKTIDVDRHARHALDTLFQRGYRGPIQDPDDPEQIRPHSIVTFNIPRKCVPNNASTLHDVFAGIALHNSNLSVYTKLLGMLSISVTQPINGFGDQATAGSDKRGVVHGNGSELLFEHNGKHFNRTIQCIEDLVTPSNIVVGHRVWIFVLDPALNIGKAMRDVSASNHTIYHTAGRGNLVGVAESNAYIHHANVHTESQIYDLFSFFVADGIQSCTVEQHTERSHFKVMESTFNAISQGVNRNGRSIVDKDSELHPSSVLSPLAAFTFHINRVCEQQRDIDNYFHIPPEGGDGDMDVDREEEEEGDIGVGEDGGDGDLDLADEEFQAVQRFMGGDGGDGEAGVANTSSGTLPRRGASDFMQFPCPDLVQRIPIYLFGRKLLNVPLRIAYTARDCRRDDIDIESIPLEVISSELGMREMPSEDTPPRERKRELRELYERHVSGVFEEGNESYFSFDEYEINFHSLESCVAVLRNIYRCFLVSHDMTEIQVRLRELRQTLTAATRVILHDEAVVDFEDEARGPSALPVPLPEICSEEGVSLIEVRHFAEKDDFLKLRLENHARYNRIVSDYTVGSEDFNDEMKLFRKESAEKFWSVFLESENIPKPICKARAFFKNLNVQEQWPEHYTLCRDLSAFANMMLLFVSRYNQIFRGATTQTIFLLLYTISINTSMYHFGLRPNALLTGDGGAGKSYPMLAVEALVAPGTFKAYTHITSKAFSTGKAFSDQTFCMHEAARGLIGVDERGFDNSGDPIFKDRLTRQRSGTLAFGRDESGQRITIEEETMCMMNHILATNDAVPEETKALMQRFINVPVHYTKRLGFNKGDQSHVNASEVNRRLEAKHKRSMQTFSFYCMVVEKMIEAWVIPEPSIDCANTFMREVLGIYREETGIDTSDSRKRTMVTHLMRTGAVMNAVHVVLCSPKAWEICYKTGPDGIRRVQPFHPQMVVDHVMPRLFVTDEIAIFYMTMCSFMWEPRNQWDILDTFVSTMNGAPQKEDSVLSKKTTNFRYVKNPKYKPYRNRGGGASRTSFSVQGIGAGSDAAAEREEPEFLIDTGYVSITTNALNLAYTKISHAATGSRPSTTEIRRVINSLKKTWRTLHKSRIVPVTRDELERVDNGGDENADPDADMLEEEDLDPELRDLCESSSDGASTIRMPGAATIGSGRAAPAPQGDLGQEEIYRREMFRWTCDKSVVKDRSAPVVIIEPDPTSRSNRFVISVMIEAIMDDTFQDGIMRAIRLFMEKSNVPDCGRKILTASDYKHKVNGSATETMPQYKDVIKLRRTDKPMIIRHMPIGTQDSNAFIKSTIHYNPTDINPSQVIMQNSLGTRIDDPPNAHYARIHWRACDLPPSNEWYKMMPETDSEAILELQDAVPPDQLIALEYVENYPEGPATMEIRRRTFDRYMRENPSSEHFDQFLVNDSDFHKKTALAELIHPLSCCHFDFENGRVIFNSSATEEDQRAVQRLVESSDAFASNYSQARHNYRGRASPRVQQRPPKERIVRSSRGVRDVGDSFADRLQRANRDFESLMAESHSTISAVAPGTKKRRRKSAANSSNPVKRRKASKVSWEVGESSAIH